MKKNKLIVLVVVTLIVLIAALVAQQQQESAVSNQAAKPLFPGLGDKINQVSELEITKGSNIVTIARKEDGWKIVEKDLYPANISKVKQTLLKIAEFKTLEAKTKKPENFGKLNVEDPKQSSAKSVLATLKDTSGTTLASVVVGRQVSSLSAVGAEKTYVRKMDDNQVWLASGGLLLDDLAIDWLDETILDIPESRIRKISIVPASAKTLVIQREKPEDQDFILVDLPKNKELKTANELKQTARLLQGLRMKDVASADKVDMSTNPVIKTIINTFDGLVITAENMEKDNNHYVKLSVAFDAEQRYKADAVSASEQTEAGQKPQAPAAQTAAALKSETETQTEAQKLNEKLSSWVFTLSKSKGASFIKSYSDLLKDKE